MPFYLLLLVKGNTKKKGVQTDTTELRSSWLERPCVLKG